MSWPVRIHRLAQGDLERSTRYYKSKGIGNDFLRAYDEACDRIAATPYEGSPHLRDTRLVKFRTYRHYLIYTVDAFEVVIYAVMFGPQRQRYWLRRLRRL